MFTPASGAGFEEGQAMRKFAAKWRDRAWRREALRTAGGWVVSGVVRELVRTALGLWLEP
ncbi:hypothetical protein M2159_008453 [Streptomyces sp. SAI-090]|nr:hypothetical protein [Streptomyces sp. SAI-090]